MTEEQAEAAKQDALRARYPALWLLLNIDAPDCGRLRVAVLRRLQCAALAELAELAGAERIPKGRILDWEDTDDG